VGNFDAGIPKALLGTIVPFLFCSDKRALSLARWGVVCTDDDVCCAF
jgi:hypothetical protein